MLFGFRFLRCFEFVDKIPRVVVLDESLIKVDSFVLFSFLSVVVGFNSV